MVVPVLEGKFSGLLMAHDTADNSYGCVQWIFIVNKLFPNAIECSLRKFVNLSVCQIKVLVSVPWFGRWAHLLVPL